MGWGPRRLEGGLFDLWNGKRIALLQSVARPDRSSAGGSRKPSSVSIYPIHGEKDALIPISMGRKLSQSVPARIEFHNIPGASHSTVFSEARELIYAKLRGQVEEPPRQ